MLWRRACLQIAEAVADHRKNQLRRTALRALRAEVQSTGLLLETSCSAVHRRVVALFNAVRSAQKSAPEGEEAPKAASKRRRQVDTALDGPSAAPLDLSKRSKASFYQQNQILKALQDTHLIHSKLWL